MIDQYLLDRLACPVCIAPLKSIASDKLQCAICRRLYPIRDGIPILLESEAEKP